MDLINKLEKGYYTTNGLSEDSWNYFIGLVAKSFNENPNEWLQFFKQNTVKYLCYKYFTRKKEQINTNAIDSYLKIELKDYYSALISAQDSLEVLQRIQNLPIQLVYLIIRKCYAISPKFQDSIVVTKGELKNYIKEYKKKRLKVAENIMNVSMNYETILNFRAFCEVYDVGCFYENNFINQGILEFIHKMLSKPAVTKKIIELGVVAKSIVISIQDDIINFPSYLGYLKINRPCFNEHGYQIANRFKDYLDLLFDKGLNEYVVDNNSVFKEPYMYLFDAPNDKYSLEDESEKQELTKSNNSSGISISGGSGGGAPSLSNSADIDVPDMGTFEVEDNENDNEVADTPDELPDEFGEQ